MKTALTSFFYLFSKRHEFITKIAFFKMKITNGQRIWDWCSCRPLSPKRKVNNHHYVFIEGIGEWVPNSPHSHNMFTSLSDRLLDLLGRLPFPCSHKFLHFPSRTALDVENTLSFIIETGELFSFRYLSIQACILARKFVSYSSLFVFLTSA